MTMNAPSMINDHHVSVPLITGDDHERVCWLGSVWSSLG